jgi:phospholipid transport system substrate-binding protein
MRFTVLLTLLVALLTPSLASAQGGPATRYLREQNERVTGLLRQHPTTDAARTLRDQQVTQSLVDILDFDELCRRSLDQHWASLTAAQQTEFSSLLRQLVERNYRTSQERIVDYEIRYVREETTASGVIVHTMARSRASRREPEVAIDYTMHMVGHEWRVVDVTTDGADMVHNYQQQFHRFITRDGFDGLLTRMRERLAEGGGSGSSTGAAAPSSTPPASSSSSTTPPTSTAPASSGHRATH